MDGRGIYANKARNGISAQINIKDMNVQTNNNGLYGISALGTAKINIESTSGENWIQANNNKNATGIDGVGIYATEAGTEINIKNMNIQTNGNYYGINALDSAKINITGITSGKNMLQANNNKNAAGSNGTGIYAKDANTEINISNMNMQVNGNGFYGIYAESAAKIDITGIANGSNLLEASNNRRHAIYANGLGTEINIKNMNINASNNGVGLWGGNNGLLSITGSSKGNTIIANNNETYGIESNGLDVNNGSIEVSIKDMNIQANNNGNSGTINGVGIYAQRTGKMEIIGNANGTNWIQVNNNKTSNNSTGGGIIANIGEITIENMSIEANNNNAGITAYNTGKINITGIASGINNLVVNGNIANNSTGKGISVYDAGSEINITNMNIHATQNNDRALLADNGGKMNITGNGNNNIYVTGRAPNGINGTAILSTQFGSLIDIKDSNIISTNNGYSAVGATYGGEVNFTGKADRNTMIVKDGTHNIHIRHKSSGGQSSKGTISNMNIFSNKVFATVGEGGTLDIDNSSIYMNANSTAFYTVDDADITLNEVDIYGSDILLDTTKSIIDPTNTVNLTATNTSEKVLTGSIKTATDVTTNVDFDNVSWLMRGSSNITNFTALNTNIDLRGSGYNTLVVDNMNMSGTSDLHFNTYFDGGNSTDKIIVNSGTMNSSGEIFVTSKGDDGSQSDVMLIDWDNASASTGTYTLHGNVVDSGAYEYELNKVGNNWYLQSNGRATGTAKMVAAAPSLHYSIIRTGQNELRKRLGQLRGNNPQDKNGAWVRTYAKNMNVSENSDSKLNLFGMEAGYDHLVYFDCCNKVYLGVMGGYLYSDNIKNKVQTSGSAHSSAHANTPSIGAYATWINYNGWFADVTFREFFSDMKITSYTSGGQAIGYNSKRNFHSASAEFGKEISYHLSSNSKFIFEPKVEAQYFIAKADKFNTNSLGNTLSYDETQSISTRAALLAGYKKRLSNGNIIEPFVEVGYSHEWDGKTDVEYAGGQFDSDLSGGTYDVGAGVHVMLTNGVNFYGDVTYENGSVIEALAGNLGVRVTW